MHIDRPTQAPQPHHLRRERPDHSPRRAHDEHGLECRPDRIEDLDLPTAGLWDPQQPA